MKYSRLKKSDLAKFATDRQITVNSSKPGKDPQYRDYVKALEAADRDATFRFLDLPPELRTWVYDDLLILNNSFTCYPQILRTCKQIKNEATNTLYGHNLIDIRICPDGVYAHGERCGDYEPGEGFPHRWCKIEWPDFLCRAQFIRISVSSGSWPNGHTFPPSVLSDLFKITRIGIIVHSLCAYLTRAYRLRSIQFDFSLIRCSDVQLHEIIYPVRLLGHSPEVSLLRDGTSIRMNAFDLPSTSSRKSFLESDTWSKLQTIWKCHLLRNRIMSIFTNPSPAEKTRLERLNIELTIRALAINPLHRRGYLGGVFERAVYYLRELLEFHALHLQDEDLLQKLHEMFRLEIDMINST